MRIRSDYEYSKLSQEDAPLKTMHWSYWHDNAGIGSTGILQFLVREMYDPAIHLTNEENLAKKWHHKKSWCTSTNRTVSSVREWNVWQFIWWPGAFHATMNRMSERSVGRSSHSRCWNYRYDEVYEQRPSKVWVWRWNSGRWSMGLWWCDGDNCNSFDFEFK